jgi:hypothetical protein
MIHKAELINQGIDNDACKLELNPPANTKGAAIIATPRLPYRDVFITFIDPEGKYILVRRNNNRMHWGDCETPVTFEYILAAASDGAEEEKNEKSIISAKPGMFKRDSKG